MDDAFEQIRRLEVAKERIMCFKQGFNINEMHMMYDQEKVKLLHEFIAVSFFESKFKEFKNM